MRRRYTAVFLGLLVFLGVLVVGTTGCEGLFADLSDVDPPDDVGAEGCGVHSDCGDSGLCVDESCTEFECRRHEECHQSLAEHVGEEEAYEQPLSCGQEVCFASDDECSEHVSCPDEQVCEDGSCEERCEGVVDCHDENLICDIQSGRCVECLRDDDCDVSQSCVERRCADHCDDNRDCSAEEQCVDGNCL